jgi:hypothetical protein
MHLIGSFCQRYVNLRAPLLTPFNGQPPICDGLFKKNLRDTLKLNHVAKAMRFRFASSRVVLFEFGSFQRSIEVPKANRAFATHPNARFGLHQSLRWAVEALAFEKNESICIF